MPTSYKVCSLRMVNIDRVIQIIRGSQTVQIAKASLIDEFALDDVQARHC